MKEEWSYLFYAGAVMINSGIHFNFVLNLLNSIGKDPTIAEEIGSWARTIQEDKRKDIEHKLEKLLVEVNRYGG